MRFRYLLTASLLVLATACGGKDSTGPGGNNYPNGSFSGTVNGAAFNPVSVAMTYSVFSGSQAIIGFGSADAQGRSFGFGIIVEGVGTFTISQTNGNNASFVEGASSFTAAFGVAGSSGSVTLTAVGPTRVAGTYTFTLVANQGSTGTRTISGSFDIDPSYYD